MMRTTALRRGGGWVWVQLPGMAAVLVLPWLDHGRWSSAAGLAGGVVMLTVAAGVALAGARALGRNLTPFPEPRTDGRLVRHGIYARIRHPLYSAVMLGNFGWALVWGSPSAMIAALVMVPLFHGKARHEERLLRERFPGYADYQKRVPGFWPRVWDKPAGRD